MKKWDLPILYPDESIILSAARIKAVYGLGIVDSYVAAFALKENSQLVTKDKDFEVLKKEINILMVGN